DNRDVGDEPTRTTHRDVGSVPKRRERVGALFTACLTPNSPQPQTPLITSAPSPQSQATPTHIPKSAPPNDTTATGYRAPPPPRPLSKSGRPRKSSYTSSQSHTNRYTTDGAGHREPSGRALR